MTGRPRTRRFPDTTGPPVRCLQCLPYRDAQRGSRHLPQQGMEVRCPEEPDESFPGIRVPRHGKVSEGIHGNPLFMLDEAIARVPGNSIEEGRLPV
jgi:hypothetical protein